jgi:L-alanine-DL-glutamate epimerase-like enolase superfamily enzyme
VHIDRSKITVYKLPYPRPVRWKDTVEDGCTFMLLQLYTDDGLVGVAEGPIKPTWTGTTRGSLAAALDEMLLPALDKVDLADTAAMRKRLSVFPENRLAKGLIDNACWDLRAQAQGVPLWRLWGGKAEVPVSWTITREAPGVMAREASDMVERYGFRTLKIKGGQGFETDAQALKEIRAAIGPDVSFYVDANAAYTADQVPGYVRMLAENGATHAEDPCDLRPNRWLRETMAASPIPFVVDTRCLSVEDAELFLEQGTRAIGIKSARVGSSIALDIARMADAAGCRVNVGLHAESALGAFSSLHVAAAFPRHADTLPAESTFFLSYADQILHESPQIRGGKVTLSDASGGFASLIDWDKVERYRV